MTSSPNKTILARRRRSKSALLRWLCYLAIALTVGSLMMIVAYICINGVPHLSWELLFGEYSADNPSMVFAIAATLELVALSLVISGPLGVGCADLGKATIQELNRPQGLPPAQRQGRLVRQLARKVCAKEACSACYAALIHALEKLDGEGALARLPDPLCIGQGFRGQSDRAGVGIGNCCAGFARKLPGCPPTALQIRDFLRGL